VGKLYFSLVFITGSGLRSEPFIFGIRETRGQTGKSQDAGLSELRIRDIGEIIIIGKHRPETWAFSEDLFICSST